MAMSAGKSDGEPMMEMNTTPLIDVMLCLLIMFIMSIPVATHSIDIDLPVATPPTDTPPPIDPVKNKIVLTQDSKVMWNGTQIDQGRLVQTLEATTRMTPEPELQFQPEPEASYELSAQVLEVIKASQVTKFGFVGNEQFATFGK
ncbi:biopolymer transporter ExbD [Novosphingobium resinovorum]|uniref:Biopolymer transport ExbD transmembrane protein n=1 Tax=Novosphingobium resinovorum TaxID=158500 RepID=A0A031JEJ6_9SPHN|nr:MULTISPECIES: biopolymer transporter ExbD [Sphingomonadaceae]AOR77986.1 biopolymer transporter ExbD [Novosphingobium resinovorum]EJU13059.1 biopolymer transport ExbD transmembrane protein [Sphingomonas sp. LH128]EZP72564.1 Biopolymer transport ExbD transmembrane protein [Novosphingobium resinovorum]MBF7010085.1 biopolymer transporter ExbD [Novosphingobium sp. HR1a]WJM28105.1 biopolymer transporter ExbD [Novosphingobium resinovorum]